MKVEVRTVKSDQNGVYVRADGCKVRPMLDRELFEFSEETYGHGGVQFGQVVELRPTESPEWCEVTLASGKTLYWMKYYKANPI